MNVVEADHRDILRDREAGIFEGADSTDGGDVVEAEDGGEVARLLEQRLHGLVADLGRHGVVAVLHRPSGCVDADNQRVVELEADLFGDQLDGLPAELGVGNGFRAAHKGYAAMAEIVEVDQGQLDCKMVIEHDVGDVFDGAVGGDGHHWQWNVKVVRRGIEQQKAVNGALDEHAWILLEELVVPVVAGGEVEVVGCGQLLHNATHHAGEVALG